jgi:hypothetical protein
VRILDCVVCAAFGADIDGLFATRSISGENEEILMQQRTMLEYLMVKLAQSCGSCGGRATILECMHLVG